MMTFKQINGSIKLSINSSQEISGILNHQTFRTGSPLLGFAYCFASVCWCACATRPAIDFSNCSCLQFQSTHTNWSSYFTYAITNL